ncbi:MAG TPA: bi-domain-containing oxidoreductase [Pyrinomonadaceae bacterium]|nr:bi-domain-containing oxidoreductase [Pyrinomonadaceae bacterium]
MKQILQNNKTGRMAVADVPSPIAQRGRVLVRAAASLISAGTEKMAVDEGKKSLLERARERPELVRQVIEKAKNEGVIKTINAVRSKLGSSTALGYSAAGIVLDVGEDVTEFRAGERVACAGAGYASHAEVLSVPKNLCVRLPDEVSFEEGAFGTLGAIALQGVRLAEPTLGEAVVVVGLGLLGQITVQLLKANGCRVFGVDLDPAKVELARELGADAAAVSDDGVRRAVAEWSRGRGADAVLITAATSSNQPIELAGEISRVKGRVVAVGMVGMDVPRNLYFKRELSLTVSMSYGPGRYDPEYEERGHDYPFAYVRWTENRNIEAFLDLVAAGRVKVERLITHRFPIEEGERAYQLIGGETGEPYLGIVLQYDTERELERRIEIKRDVKSSAAPAAKASAVRVGMIGAGVYAQAMLLPNFKAAGAGFRAIATAGGVTARDLALKFGFDYCASDADEILNDPEVNLIVVATRHNLHAELARRALLAGKHVFVEKPLALNEEELEGVLDAGANSAGRLTVGFNRRFSPLARAAREFYANRQSPLSISYRVNAGRIPKSHWLQDPVEGGGRIVGEVCHFVDLMHFLTGSRVTRVYAEPVAGRDAEAVDEDNVFVTLRFADGSNGSIAYLSEGDKVMPKERVEIFGGGKSFVLDDFRGAAGYAGGREDVTRPRQQDKGQADEARAVCEMVLTGGEAPIALDDLAATTSATFAMLESLRTGRAVEV